MYQKIQKITRRMVFIDVEDIVHDVWIWFFLHPLIDPCFKAIRWRVLDQLRKRRKEKRLNDEILAREEVEPGLGIDVNELVEKAMLNDEEQMILYYKFVQGMSLKEISEKMNLGRVRVSVQVKGILERMKGLVT